MEVVPSISVEVPPRSGDCTSSCQLSRHADVILAAITKRTATVSDEELCAFLDYVCSNCGRVRDATGKTALHFAAGCGRLTLVRWLITCRLADVNAIDLENGWTALHVAIYYGQLHVAIELMRKGAVMFTIDTNSMSPIDYILAENATRIRSSAAGGGGQIYAWGTNMNHTMGQLVSPKTPTVLECFHKTYPWKMVKSVHLERYHTVIHTEDGEVFSCGHGLGGRLGNGLERAQVVPAQIHFDTVANQGIACTSVAIAENHSLFHLTDYTVYSCGLNTNHVLGVSPPPPLLLTPTEIPTLTNHRIRGVACSKYHSLAWNERCVYAWGWNRGQLGPVRGMPSFGKTLVTPRVIFNVLNFHALHEDKIVIGVVATVAATIIHALSGRSTPIFYILHGGNLDVCYPHLYKELSVGDAVLQVAAFGGQLLTGDEKHSIETVGDRFDEELKMAVLTKRGHLLIWRQSSKTLLLCTFRDRRALSLSFVHMNCSELLLTTTHGEVYRLTYDTVLDTHLTSHLRVQPIASQCQNFLLLKRSSQTRTLSIEACYAVELQLQRIDGLHRAICAVSDPAGVNFITVQMAPYEPLPPLDYLTSTFQFTEQLEEKLTVVRCGQNDGISDVRVRIKNGAIFYLHAFFLCAKYPEFIVCAQGVTTALKSEVSGYFEIDLPTVDVSEFRTFLDYVYSVSSVTNRPNLWHCPICFLVYEMPDSTLTKLMVDSIDAHHSAPDHDAICVSGDHCYFTPDTYKYEEDDENRPSNAASANSYYKYHLPRIYNPSMLPELYDVRILCQDGEELSAHKCVLTVRMEYFSSLLSSRWNNGEISTITLEFAKSTVSAMLHFLYTDTSSANQLMDIVTDTPTAAEMHQWYSLLILSDQLCYGVLKDRCQIVISRLLNLRNCISVLQVAHTYHASLLKDYCFNFIILNLASFLECHLLNGLTDNLLVELRDTAINRKGFPSECRRITPFEMAASDELIAAIACKYPVDFEVVMKSPPPTKPRGVIRKKRTSTLSNSEEIPCSPQPEPYCPKTPPKITPNAISLDHNYHYSLTNVIDFPELNREAMENCSSVQLPPKNSPRPIGFKHKPVKVSQKERLQQHQLAVSSSDQDVKEQSSVNPWKQSSTSQSSSSIQTIEINDNNIDMIILAEKQKKVNLRRLRTKSLRATQIEEQAISNLKAFYAVNNADEIIEVVREADGPLAEPVWVPETNRLSSS